MAGAGAWSVTRDVVYRFSPHRTARAWYPVRGIELTGTRRNLAQWRDQIEMIVPAGNRQLKLMRFFGVPVAEVSADVARRVISDILANPTNREQWDKYVYLTHDVSSESAYLKPFDSVALKGVAVPRYQD